MSEANEIYLAHKAAGTYPGNPRWARKRPEPRPRKFVAVGGPFDGQQLDIGVDGQKWIANHQSGNWSTATFKARGYHGRYEVRVLAQQKEVAAWVPVS